MTCRVAWAVYDAAGQYLGTRDRRDLAACWARAIGGRFEPVTFTRA